MWHGPIPPLFRSATCAGWNTRQTISLLDKAPPDDGLAGAKLAMSDNNTTGRFMNQQFELSDAPVRADDEPVAMLAGLAERGIVLMLSDLPADRLADTCRCRPREAVSCCSTSRLPTMRCASRTVATT